MSLRRPDVLCICGSSGSLSSIQMLVQNIPSTFTVPIIVLVHQQEDRETTMDFVIGHGLTRPVIVPDDGMEIVDNVIYVAPSGYHIQVEGNKRFSYAMDEPVHFSRPSIDILLETIAPVYQSKLMVILLSGSSKDGSYGTSVVESYQGTVWIQDPSTTPYKMMVTSAIDATEYASVLTIPMMIERLQVIGGDDNVTESTSC